MQNTSNSSSTAAHRAASLHLSMSCPPTAASQMAALPPAALQVVGTDAVRGAGAACSAMHALIS